jgi:hypothetical protein
MNGEFLKRVSRRLVIELAVVVALVSYNVRFPSNKSFPQAWGFVLRHPLTLLHVIVGTIIIAEAVILLLRILRRHDRTSIILASVGLAFVLLAYASGEIYVATQRSSAVSCMGIGWFGAIVTYGLGWYLGHKKPSVLPAKQPGA